MVFTYSKMGRVTALNVETISSICLLHLAEMSALRMLSVCFALVMVTFICCENVSVGFRVIPKIFGLLLLVVFGCVIFSWVWCKKFGCSFVCFYI